MDDTARRSETSTQAAVQVQDVSMVFDGTPAVDAASFDLAHGRFLTILGPSGSGKTTLLRMIAGFQTPTAGEIFIKGTPVSTTPPHKRSIGMVFQKLALFPHMTAAENVAYPLKMRRFAPADIPGRVKRYLELVQLGPYADRRIHQLSGGQQQRVAIARALVFEPDLLLLDEPLAALDRKLREEMQLEFRRIQQELGVTTINVTHDQREALVVSDEVIVMDDGRIQQMASPTTTYGEPANRFVANFIGVTNFLPGEVIGAESGRARVRVAGHELEGRVAEPLAAGTQVDCALRAEHARILGEAEAVSFSADAVITESIFEGDRTVYSVVAQALGGAQIRVFDTLHAGAGNKGIGDAVRIGWDSRHLMVFPR
ncbi:ABC transporter ATP-binding protein [Pelagibacterium montanilacus]|uniref:ABC transporter ATP-binding protein n=1 Tax=Pelagibacterium montanilacus TaxID=2185280 RepID=UPI000F8F5932|nr:ABC transporter ATP-binding protein [Pelagibacterium montanilacus]